MHSRILALAAWICTLAAHAATTALDRYVAAPDPNYKYELINTIPGEGFKTYVLEMTSQQWRTKDEVNRPIWKHWLTIVVPQRVTTDIGFLFITGGSNFDKPPAAPDGMLPSMALATGSVASEYFDIHGRSLRAAFLRAPVEFRRISSGFGMRMHPILKVWRAHRGTDYVAPAGTPVRAIGDGTVVFAGQKGGYGNVIDLRHHNGYITRYGHLSRFAPGIRRGTRVTIGKTIAYVGMTGLATAPHLHFEVLVDGVQHDPRVALRDRGSGEPVPPARRPEFDALAQRSMAALRTGPVVGAVAVN